MKTRLVMFILLVLVCFGGPLTVLAENSYTARELLRSTYVFVQATNQKEWLAVEVLEKDEYKTFLIGPDGYRRDLSPFMSISETQRGAYVSAIADDGTIYFETSSFTDEGVLIERKLYSLSRESEEARLIDNVTRKGTLISTASINRNGDLLTVEYDELGLNDSVELRTFVGTSSHQRTLSFPNRIKRGDSSINQYFDNQGRFLITREQVTRLRRKLVDICAGDVRSDAVVCATADQLAKGVYRGKGYISAFSGGRVLVENMGRFKLIDSTTFEVMKSFRFRGYNTFSTYMVGEDLSIVGIGSSSFRRTSRTPMIVLDPLLGEQRYSCDFIPKDRTSLLSFSQIFKPTGSHIYIVAPGWGGGRDADSAVLYELSSSETQFPGSMVVGGCSVKKKVTL